MGVKFDELEVERQAGRAARFASAARTWTARETLRVRLRSTDGAWWEGEAAPLPGASVETLEDVEREAQGLDPATLEVDGPVAGWALGRGSPSLRFALETAALAARARAERISPVALLGGDPRRRIPVNGLVDGLGRDGERLAYSWLRRGVRVLKVKVGRPQRTDDEIALLDRLWRGTSATLRLDANGRLGPRLAAWVRAHRGRRMAYVEDPGPGIVGVPRALDAELLANPGGFDAPDVVALVFKPTLWGGWGGMAREVERARASGKDIVITHALEVGVGFDAVVDIALAAGTPGVAQGVAPHGFLRGPPSSPRWLQGWIRGRLES